MKKLSHLWNPEDDNTRSILRRVGIVFIVAGIVDPFHIIALFKGTIVGYGIHSPGSLLCLVGIGLLSSNRVIIQFIFVLSIFFLGICGGTLAAFIVLSPKYYGIFNDTFQSRPIYLFVSISMWSVLAILDLWGYLQLRAYSALVIKENQNMSDVSYDSEKEALFGQQPIHDAAKSLIEPLGSSPAITQSHKKMFIAGMLIAIVITTLIAFNH